MAVTTHQPSGLMHNLTAAEIERLSAAATVEPATDEKGRPLTHWGGMAEKVDAESAEPVAIVCGWSMHESNPTLRLRPDIARLDLGTKLYTRPPAPKAAWIDATTVERNSRPPAPKVSEEKVLEIVDRHMATCRVGQYRQTMVDAINEVLELAGRK